MPSEREKTRRSFINDVLKIAGGTTIAQVLSILATPLVTRLYGPESYGLSALFVSIVGIVGVLACLRYELAIMLPKEDDEAANLLAASLVFSVAIGVLTVPLVYLGAEPVASLLRSPKLGSYLWLVPPGVFAYGMVLAFSNWISRTRHFGSLSVAKMASSVSTTGTQLAAGFSGHATGGNLILANILGSVVSAVMLGAQVWHDDRALLWQAISRRGMIKGISRYRKFPLIDTWSALLNTVSWQLPVFLLSTFFSSAVVGYYSLSMMVLQLPASLIGGAISQVFFQRAAEAKFEGRLSGVVEDTVLRLAVLGLLPMLLLSVMGKEAFVVVFGAAWSEAGVYSQILALWIFLTFISSPPSTLFCVFEKQGSLLMFNIALLLLRAGAITAGGLMGSAMVAVALFALVGVVLYSALLIWLLSQARVSWIAILRRLMKYLASSILLVSVIGIAKWVVPTGPILLVLMAASAALIYYGMLTRDGSGMFADRPG